MAGIETGFVDANGQRLHYARVGTGPRMVFLHGFPQFWYCWRHQLAEFGRDHLALAPDQRGYNLSAKPQGVEAYAVRHLVEDLRQFAGAFGDGPFVLVAHDWGGAIAWNLAIESPELLSHLVIVNSPHPYTFWRALAHDAAQQAASAYMLLLRSARAEQLLSEDAYARLWKFAFGNGGPVFTAEDRAAYLSAWAQPGALRASLNWYRASPLYPPAEGDAGAARFTLEAKNFMVRVPTLVVHGERDTALLPTILEGLEACVPDLRIERIPDATHWVAEEKPVLLNGLIRRFIESTPARAL